MKKLFNHILVPVTLNENSNLLLEKAVQVANRFDCDIHLLYVQTPVMAIPFVFDGNQQGAFYNNDGGAAEMKLQALANESRSALSNGLLMTATVGTGNWHNIIKEQVITRQIDLVMLTRSRGEVLYKLDVNQLAQQTQCPVLTVTEGFDAGHLQNIVVPIDDFLPIKKLTAATYLARKFNAVIHLMGGRSDSFTDDKKKARSLTRAYQLLRDYTNVKVYCSTQQGDTMAEDALAYAKNVNADLIVVNSGKESQFKGWFSKWMRKSLYKESNIPVLTISRG